MKNQKLTIFLDGQYKVVSFDQLKSFSPGFLNGLGVFETLLCEQKKVYFLAEHYRRFLYGCDRYILPPPPSMKEVKKILGSLLAHNKLSQGRVRIAAWRTGSETHFAALVIPREPFKAGIYRRGFAACLYPQPLDRSPELAKIKSLDYRFFLKAYEYGLKNHCHEALFVNSQRELVEGSRSNVFFVKGRKLFTAHLSCGSLAGITRQAVLKAAKDVGIKAKQVRASLEDLQNSDEAFLTNALVGIMPLTELAGHRIGKGRPGLVTSRLMKSYKKLSQKQSTFLV